MASWICHPCAAFTVCRGSVPAGKEKSCPSRQKGSRNGCAPKFHKPEKMASQFNISSLSLAGQSVTIIQAGLLALGHRSPRLPESISDTLRFARQYSGGTAPALHRSSLLSPVGRLYVLFNCGVATPLTRYFKQKSLPTNRKGSIMAIRQSGTEIIIPDLVAKISYPSFVDQTVIVRQAVLLALDLRSLKPSQDDHPSGVA